MDFLIKFYLNTYMKEELAKSGNGVVSLAKKIATDIEKLEITSAKSRDNDEVYRRLRELYYAKCLVKEEDIPDSYYEAGVQKLFGEEDGKIEYSGEIKHQEAMMLIKEQQDSLDTWLDYFTSGEVSSISYWAKYWMFQSVLSIGNYDKGEQQFYSRTKETTGRFIELDRESLALAYDYLIKYLQIEKISDKEERKNKLRELSENDEELEKVIETKSFNKMYTYLYIRQLTSAKLKCETTDGEWVLFKQGSEPLELVNRLKGFGTGWSIAGEEFARSYLEKGDINIYFSADSNGAYKIPRVCIIKKGNNLAEIMGVAKEQNLDGEIREVLDKKLNEYPDKDRYQKQVRDMNLLTNIYKKTEKNEQLTKEEITFLYEINESILGFGHGKDSRIEELKSKRDKKKDLAYLFDCAPSQISLTLREASSENILFHYGDLDLTGINRYLVGLNMVKGSKLPQTILGNLIIPGKTKGLTLPQTVKGNLIFGYLIGSAKRMVLPQMVEGDVISDTLATVEDVVFPQTVKGDLVLNALHSVKRSVLPQMVEGSVNLNSLESPQGIVLPKIIDGDLNLGSLLRVNGLVFPELIRGYLNLKSLRIAEGLPDFVDVGDRIYLRDDKCNSYEEFLIGVQRLELESRIFSYSTFTDSEKVTYELSRKVFKNGYDYLTEEEKDMLKLSRKVSLQGYDSLTDSEKDGMKL